MFAPAGLAALSQGYDQGAINYWKRRQLETEQATSEALGAAGMQLVNNGMGGSGGFTPGPPPPGGAPPVALPPPMAPRSATPTYTRIPYVNPDGSPARLVPGSAPGGGPLPSGPAGREAAAVNAGTWQPTDDYAEGLKLAQASLENPPAGGPTMGGQPGAPYSQIMPGGPPGGVPIPPSSLPQGGPPPGGPPQMPGGPPGGTMLRPPPPPGPPPGAPGAPPGGAPGAPMQLGPRPPMGMPPQPGAQPGAQPGGMPGAQPSAMSQMPTWRDMAAALVRANPNIKPDVFWNAMERATKTFLAPQAQLQYRLDTISLREQMLAEREREANLRDARQAAGQGIRVEEGAANRAVRVGEGEANRAVRTGEGEANRAVRREEGAANRASREGIAEANRQAAAARAEDTKAFRDRIATVREDMRDLSAYYRSPEGKAAVIAGTAGAKADQTSLQQQTKILDQINNFSRNEMANLDRLVALGDKIDATGSPVLERWIRAGKKAVAGDPDVTKFDAQLEITIPGIARILSGNPTLAGVVSNRAREDIRNIMDKNFTSEQLHAIAPLIESDMATRVGSIQDQINIINARIHGTPAPVPTAPGARVPGAVPVAPTEPAATAPTKLNGKAYYPTDDGGWTTTPPKAGGEGARPFDQESRYAPAHLPGTKPADYLRELYENPNILARGIEQASGFAGATRDPGAAALRGLLSAGKSLSEIGKQFGVSAPAALKWLRKYGLEAAGGKGGVRSKYSDEKLKELVMQTTDKRGRAATQEGVKTWAQVGKELGVSAAAAYQKAQKLGLISVPEVTERGR
jgi:transposase